MKNFILLLLLFLSFSSTAQTIRATATTEVESGNMRFVIRNDGSLFHKDGEMSQFTAAENAEGEKPALLDFAGLWIGSIHQGQFKTSIADNRNIDTTHFAPGPSYSPTGTLSLDKQEIFNQIWKVTDVDIAAHITDFRWDGKVDTIRESVFMWPGYGNKHFQELFDDTEENEAEERYLVKAPFYDGNDNGIYEPNFGEYPVLFYSLGEKTIDAKQLYYTVYNDYNNPNENMGINVHQTIATIDCDYSSILNNTVFVDYQFTNKSTSRLDSLHFGLFVDSALSCSENNYAGTDTISNSLYFYNGKDFDNSVEAEQCEEENSPFAPNTPVLSLIDLGRKWDYTTYYNSVPSLSPGVQTRPNSVIEYYRYLKGLWRDGTPFTYGGNGYGLTQQTPYIFTGNPEIQEGWTMKRDSLNLGVPERYFLATTECWSYAVDENGNLITEFGELVRAHKASPLFPEKTTRKTFAFTLHQGEIENALTNAQTARDTLLNWYNEIIDVNPGEGILLAQNCFAARGGPQRPIEPIVPLYPNPAHDFITIRLPQKDMKYIKIYNISGQLLAEQEIMHNPDFLNSNPDFIIDTDIDISNLPVGFYAVQIEGINNEMQVHKFLKM